MIRTWHTLHIREISLWYDYAYVNEYVTVVEHYDRGTALDLTAYSLTKHEYD